MFLRFTFAVFIFAFLMVQADAKPRTQKSTKPLMGTCEMMLGFYKPQQLWFGSFHGGKNDEIGMDIYFRDFKYAQSCFVYDTDCEKWLYDLNTEYQDWPMHSSCSKGFPKY